MIRSLSHSLTAPLPRRATKRPTFRQRAARCLHNRRLRVEPLEDRALLSIVASDGNAGTSNWDDADNWDTDTVPVSGDDVVIPELAGDITVELSTTAARTINSLDCQETLILSGGGSLSRSSTVC